jgi:hypothetical protein
MSLSRVSCEVGQWQGGCFKAELAAEKARKMLGVNFPLAGILS